jgi:copper homeostasis protein
MKEKPVLIEICVDSVESAVAAEKGGADRVELCDNLTEGGTTPSAGMIAQVRKNIRIGLQVIIRPRGGDFHYSDWEYEVMKYDIRLAKDLGADGIVFGLLREDGSVDKEHTRILMDLARPLPITFHRAFDMTRDPFQAMEDLISLGIERILTSGQEATAIEGLELIAELQKKAAGRITIMPGGSIQARNVARILAVGGIREIHAGGALREESPMTFRNERVYMGKAFRPPEFLRSRVNTEQVQRLHQAVS